LSNDTPRQRAILFDTNPSFRALCRAIEQHEAFKQRVSFALKTFKDGNMYTMHDYLLDPFIITKADPLVEVLNEISHEGGYDSFDHYAHRLRAALEARGLEIREQSA
jgi:hypothetical protein